MVANTYDPQTAKFIATIAQNMPDISGQVMQGWIENPRALQRVLASVLCPSEETSKVGPELKVWRTIRLGTGFKTADDFRRALKDEGFRIGDWARDVLGKPAFTVAAEETEVDLVVVSVAELGFKNRAKRSEIYKRAQERGLELCPPEIGPQLRLQYKDQPRGEWLLIGMESIAASDGGLRVFVIERDVNGLWLYGSSGNPRDVWDPDGRWVFVLPRK